jgi:DNA-binding transcriptional LysR family regulator
MSRAADVLHITPPAVSHALKRLREYLCDPLFQRSNNRMLPTPACQRMAPQIIDNLTRLRQILWHWGEFQSHSSQHHFRLGIHYALITHSKLPFCLGWLKHWLSLHLT